LIWTMTMAGSPGRLIGGSIGPFSSDGIPQPPPPGVERTMTRGAILSAVLLLLGGAVLAGCGYDPDAAPRAEAQSQRTAPAPGSFVVHMNGSVSSEVSVAR
jgi:hypothetical protein